jgi:Flp pilus assembly protein TadD
VKEALEDCNAALNLKPNNASAFDHRGMAYLKLGQPDQALADYDEALKVSPNSPAALYGRGIAKLMKGDLAASNADFEMAKEIKPSIAIAEEFTKVGVRAKPKSFF